MSDNEKQITMKINIMNRILMTACAAMISVAAWGQDRVGISGKVVDTDGNALAGVSVVVDGTTIETITDANGIYNISVPASSALNFAFVGYNGEKVNVVEGENVYNVTLSASTQSAFETQEIEMGAYRRFTRSESTAAVSVITNEDVDKRGAKNIANSILGQGNGLISLDGDGIYFDKNATFYVRGLQSLNNNSVMVLVDGIQRDITTLSPQEVESVSILKDAAAVAMFGFKGSNNVVYITTKRGVKGDSRIKISYDHLFNSLVDKPEFVDALTYAKARNEALAMEGGTAEYDDNALKAFESGKYPNYYPDVNWVDETFKDNGSTDRYTLEFNGGGDKFSYFTMMNLLTDKGFVGNPDYNDGYDTQDVYVRANLRNNLDIDISDYTKLQVNIGAVLSEMQRPGSQANLWELVHQVPSLAFPIQNEKKEWGGNATWDGTKNPVAQAQGAGYYKIHERALFADVRLDQSLSMFVEGLGFSARLGFDNFSDLYEDHSKKFVFGQTSTSFDADGNLVEGEYFTGGEEGELGSDANSRNWQRRATLNAGLTFDRTFNDNHSLYAQAKWDYEFENTTGVNTTIHRHNFSWFSHYGLMQKYYVDLALVGSGSSRLAPGHKWAFSPTVSAAWVVSNEDFLNTSDIVNFLKVRASFGIINNDFLPGDSYWQYYTQSYSQDGVTYPFTEKYDGGSSGRTNLGRMATVNPTNEKAQKINIGIDARLFGGLDVELDYFTQTNKDIWVDGAGSYSAVIGFEAPYANDGEVKSSGFEVALNYSRTIGDLTFNIGGNLTKTSSEIVNMAEEPRAFANLVRTGDPLYSSYGLKAIGLFKDQAEIDAAPTQTFTTVRPGDIRYEDVNGDGKVDANDVCKIGNSTTAPELYFSFNIGAEFKGVGLDATFQGTGKYSYLKNKEGYYWGVMDNKSVAQEVYDGRWTPENLAAEYPRLSSVKNANNHQSSDFWLEDRNDFQIRNVELYYKFGKSLLESTGFIENAKVYVRGVDLLSITNTAYTPKTRSFVIGCNLTF